MSYKVTVIEDDISTTKTLYANELFNLLEELTGFETLIIDGHKFDLSQESPMAYLLKSEGLNY